MFVKTTSLISCLLGTLLWHNVDGSWTSNRNLHNKCSKKETQRLSFLDDLTRQFVHWLRIDPPVGKWILVRVLFSLHNVIYSKARNLNRIQNNSSVIRFQYSLTHFPLNVSGVHKDKIESVCGLSSI